MGNGAPGQLAAGRPGLLKVREASGLGDEETRRAGCVQVGKQKGSGGSQAELKHNSLCVGPPDLTYQHSK
jgi:hypothetical protein